MRSVFAASVFAVAANAIDIKELEFINYLSKFGKMYKNIEEFNMRMELFVALDEIINAHNSRPSNFTMGHNPMSDWT